MAETNESINDKSRKLLKELCDKPDASDEEISKILADFRILTREKTLKLESDCFLILVNYSKLNVIEAQKCLSNLILNYSDIREPLVDPYVECVKTRMTNVINKKSEQNGDISTKHLREVLYYDLRIVFLLSALCPSVRGKIRDQLSNIILQILQIESETINDENHALVIEGLKTLFNLTLDKCVDKSLAGDVIRKLFEIFHDKTQTDERVSDPDFRNQLLVNLIHLLTNMPDEVYHKLTEEDANSILSHLDSQLKTYSRQSFRENVLPILNVCANICKHNEVTRKRWFEEIIGSSDEFDKRPEEYDTLRGRLVKLMTSVDVHIKDIAADFLHALCGGNTEKFITYTGFGNAAAFLSSRGLLSQSNRDPSSRTGSDPVDSDQQFKELRDKLDPITGKIDVPRKNPMEGMTDEEKEYHAQELATAITKLSNLGVIKPMQIDAEGNVTDIQPKEKSRD